LSLVVRELDLDKFLFIKSFPDVFSFRCYVSSIPFVQGREYPEALVKVQEDPSQLTAEEIEVERIAKLLSYW